MRRGILLIWSVVSCVAMAAQDALIMNDTVGGRVIQYADTFKLQDQEQSVSFDETELLMGLLQEQSKKLKQREDSLQQVQDSLNRQDSVWLAQQDSLRAVQLALDQARLDSIEREAEALRQLKAELLAQNAELEDTIHVQADLQVKSLVKDAEEERQELLRAKRKPSVWFKEAIGLVQFTQNYVSGNWYQGGNSSFAMLTDLKGTIKYDAKKMVTWENTGEWREGISTSRGDSLRKMNMTDDILKLYSKLNVKIYKNEVYGSASVDLQTPLFPTWKDNTTSLKTGFFTPLRFNVAVGIDYKPARVKNLSVVFAPLAYKLVYVNDTVRTSPTNYGLSAGNNKLSTFGSSVRLEWKWKPVREIALETVFYAYTNYKMIELDWEITCDFIINRYMSARVMLHPRYDSSVIMEGDEKAKMQFKELLSIGFAHKFH